MVISRSLTAALGTQFYIPPRLLFGLLPSTLLDDYVFWQNENDSLTGYPTKERAEQEINSKTPAVLKIQIAGGTAKVTRTRYEDKVPGENEGDLVLLNLMYAPEGSSLTAIGELLLRLENLSHILVWTKTRVMKSKDECFPEHDTRVLTDSGMLFLSEIEERIAAGERVLYACYDEGTQSIVYCPGELKCVAPPTHWVEFTQANTRRLWDATSDDYGSTVPANGERANRLTLRTTPKHDMFVQLSTEYKRRRDGGAPVPPHKMRAEELAPGYKCNCAAKGRTCTHGYSHYRMFTGAANGLRAPANVISPTNRDRQSPVTALGLRTEDELNAFLELFGYWLGDGTMDYVRARPWSGWWLRCGRLVACEAARPPLLAEATQAPASREW